MSGETPKGPDGNGWTRAEMMVLAELRDLKLSSERTWREINRVRIDVETLKVKAGIWGLVGGAIPTSIALGGMLIAWLVRSGHL